MDREDLEKRLSHFIRAHFGEHGELRALEGFSGSHGGLTFGFEVWDRARGGRLDALVIRLAPRGVRRSGNTDVFRQAPLLRTLKRHGYPVPAVRFAGEDDAYFDTAYVMFERLPGHAFVVWDPHPSFDRGDGEAIAKLWRVAARTLARVHAFSWQDYLADWERPTPIESEVKRWDSILEKAAEPAWIKRGRRVRELLLKMGPAPSPVGLLHGDCQPSNILYNENGEINALLDWELSAIGSQDYDLGWLVMIGDRESWHPDWCPHNPLSPDELISHYEEAAGRRATGIAWYRALAGYKMAVVTGLFTKLHREGRRPDPAWEEFAKGVPFLFDRAEMLLRGAED